MRITQLNYEKYVIDYIEGQLDLDHKRAFDHFLEDNPQIRDEITLYLSAPIMAPELTPHPDTTSLTRKLPSASYTRYWPLLLLLLIPAGYFAWGNYTSLQQKTTQTEILLNEADRKSQLQKQLQNRTSVEGLGNSAAHNEAFAKKDNENIEQKENRQSALPEEKQGSETISEQKAKRNASSTRSKSLQDEKKTVRKASSPIEKNMMASNQVTAADQGPDIVSAVTSESTPEMDITADNIAATDEQRSSTSRSTDDIALITQKKELYLPLSTTGRKVIVIDYTSTSKSAAEEKSSILSKLPRTLKPSSFNDTEVIENTTLSTALNGIKKNKKKLFARVIPKSFSKT